MSFLTRPLKGMAMAQVKPLLDKFIKGDSLDADTVQVDTTGITINNVELNIDSLLEVAGMTAALPVRIEAAVVRRLKIRISWTELLSAPLSVDLDGVYVVATLRTDASSKEQLVAALAEAEAAVSARLAQAAAAHLAAATASVGPAEVGQAGRARSMTTSLLNRLADALRLSVRDVHIRLESRPHPALQHGGSGAGTADDWAEPQLRAEREREEKRLRLLQDASALRRKVVRAEGKALRLRQSRAASSIRQASVAGPAAPEDDGAPTEAAVVEAEEEAALLRQRLAEMLQQREQSAREAVLRLQARRFQSGRRQRTRGDDHVAYAAGVTLASLTVSSITPDGELSTGVRGDKATSFLRKRVQVEGLGVYLDSGCRLAVYGNDHGRGATALDVIDLMRRLAQDRESDADGAALPQGRRPLPTGYGSSGVPTPAEVQAMVEAAGAGDAAPLKALLARHDRESIAVRREVLDRLVTPAEEALAEASVATRREMRRWRRHYRRKRAAIRSADTALALAAVASIQNSGGSVWGASAGVSIDALLRAEAALGQLEAEASDDGEGGLPAVTARRRRAGQGTPRRLDGRGRAGGAHAAAARGSEQDGSSAGDDTGDETDDGAESGREEDMWPARMAAEQALLRELPLGRRNWILTPTSISLGVVLNDAGDPPAAELEPLVRESLGMAWAETVAAEMPSELDREAALQALEASRERPADMEAELDALEEQWDDFVSDPFAALCSVSW
ncbi:hypothetical protein FNF28_05609 [Cafeteria roenbergensis]|uniref:Autophagy-related protein 2 n=1 Tax=Cafeteria roenbergensis TaxID=33653 RepID=A0A5A8D6N8_CAFRO|nr:hypothetical protein FNF28_05609 [Cafeteria roenbergensis]